MYKGFIAIKCGLVRYNFWTNWFRFWQSEVLDGANINVSCFFSDYVFV